MELRGIPLLKFCHLVSLELFLSLGIATSSLPERTYPWQLEKSLWRDLSLSLGCCFFLSSAVSVIVSSIHLAVLKRSSGSRSSTPTNALVMLERWYIFEEISPTNTSHVALLCQKILHPFVVWKMSFTWENPNDTFKCAPFLHGYSVLTHRSHKSFGRTSSWNPNAHCQ